MSYQVLARKWRPRSFKELVGQSHVLQALVNALDQDRLHHAYLFTGTRGVGKTTIARIFARCLNCEQGVSSTPCGQCSACKEIDDGRFVDLIEVDAASRTKVEDTRELLDNVQYAPTRGRYKVYLIDEVHMLSAHSFNALLKTLEEPPPHVKFLLATTDPQKLPVTILSRCLQFSLKNMTPERIVGHLENILGQEQVACDVAALWQLARAADGSMRDALSLTDQAIAFGNGRVSEAEVGAMLGTIDQGQVMKMVMALSTADAAHILSSVSSLAEHSPDYLAVLDDMLSLLHRVAIAQAVPDAVDNSQGDREQVIELASSMTAEDVQLYYQIGLVGKKDLPLAPDPRGGFEMALLRMLAFRPDGAPAAGSSLNISGGKHDEGASDPEPVVQPIDVPVDVHQADVPENHSAQVGGCRDTFELPVITEERPTSSLAEPVSQPVVAEDAQPTPVVVPLSVDDQAATIPPVDDDQAHDAGPSLNDLQAHWTSGADYSEAEGVADIPADQFLSLQVTVGAPGVEPEASVRAVVELPAKKDRVLFAQLDAVSWVRVFRGLPLGGVTGTIGSHCEFVVSEQDAIRLRLDEERSTLYNDTHRQRMEKALCDYFEQSVKLLIDTGRIVNETPAAWRERKIAERLQEARESIYSDTRIKALVETFSATVLDESIQPVDNIIK
ncbi:DNA polymerase III subunit gamma/tau [Endozoicomonas sp. SCSIO W0465]|uniref:DNA polymerase III subunit gamma/tau n=1 Tax=Endozoicomonas sp. SCSIO W0465 TaxID=2918516 RepID=UPI002075F1FB|nr:DNA polymerase III subunit gamma/tau [Endozoicomonas sp. SCSIO W0465]USE34224.1 DNA polymerase III subunit gamma/tau [Endozoicomonas sp. SCSIO W0465]